jgi:hypothetical protein
MAASSAGHAQSRTRSPIWRRDSSQSRASRGQVVAAILRTAWRIRPERLDVAPKSIEEALPLLLAPSGLAALAWWRFRHSDGAARAPAPLETERGLLASQAFLHRRDLQRAVLRLRNADVEPILVKGWAIGRFYPDPPMRPSGDLDLCVREADFGAARQALSREADLPVDLHRGFATLDEESERLLFHRSRVVDCQGIPVRVLAPEDHFRVLCTHMLRHGVSRPLWLCDVALALESRAPSFDWARCLGPHRQVAEWVTCAIGLAHRLLGARIDDTPLRSAATQLPPWLVPTVLRQWGRQHRALRPLADHRGHPLRLLAEMAAHWPNGVQATVSLRQSPGVGSPLPYQIAASLHGLMRFARGAVRWRARG